MSWLFPCLEYTLPSEKSADHAYAALASVLKPRVAGPFSAQYEEKQFVGTIGDLSWGGFDFKLTYYGGILRNSFRAVVTGRFSQEKTGSIVSLSMKLPSFNSGFMGVWLGGCAVFLLLDLCSRSLSGMAAMLLFGYGLMRLCFHYSAKKTKAALENLLC